MDLTIILVLLGFIELIIIIRLILKNKSDLLLKVYETTEYNDLDRAYNNLKKEILRSKLENESLQKQAKNLENSVQNLEKTNIDLLGQKEKLKESKSKLEVLQDQKEKLYATAVHDIKNPAAAIKSYIDLLNSYELNAQEQQEIMEYLMDSSEQILRLTQEMTEIIVKSDSDSTLNKNNASLKEIIDRVCNKNSAYANSKQIKLFNKSSTNLPSLNIDGDKIEEVLDNLINNAIKFGFAGTVVEVKSFFNEEYVSVNVIDDGVGMTEEDLSKVFTKGATLSAKSTADEASSGLGLWIVKNIIDEHDGKVWVKSKENLGTTFGFELPIT